jgi:hypothetical protein
MTAPINEYCRPQADIDEENYIREGIAKYGYDGVWKLIEELNKQPMTPVTIPMIRRTFPQIP